MQFSFFTFFSLSCHIPGHRVFLSHFPRLSVCSPKSRILLSVFFIFHIFHCFSPYSRSYSVCFSFACFSRHISCPNMWVSHFPHLSVFSPYSRSYNVYVSFSTFFSVYFHISYPIMWVSHFPLFSVFLKYSRSYSVYFSFLTFFIVSRHFPGPRMS